MLREFRSAPAPCGPIQNAQDSVLLHLSSVDKDSGAHDWVIPGLFFTYQPSKSMELSVLDYIIIIKYSFIYIYIYLFIHVLIYSFMYIYIYTNSFMYIFIHVYIHVNVFDIHTVDGKNPAPSCRRRCPIFCRPCHLALVSLLNTLLFIHPSHQGARQPREVLGESGQRIFGCPVRGVPS